MTDVANPILIETEYTGDLVIEGKSHPVKFSVSSGEECRLKVKLGKVSREVYFLAVKSSGEVGSVTTEFTLSGASADGGTFNSYRMSFNSWRHNSDGFHVTVSARVALVTVQRLEPTSKPILKLWFRGFKAFRNPIVETKLGRLLVGGEIKSVETDTMSGFVCIQANSETHVDSWREEADAFLEHMWQGLTFAHGGRLQTPRLDYIHDNVWEATFYDGRGFSSELSVINKLNQEPFIKALVERYEQDGPLSDILWTALGWMQIETSYDEVRFLTAMTALETIVQHELPERRGTIIPKDEYRLLREKLKDVIKDNKTLTDEDRETYCKRIDGNNSKTLGEKIGALFDHYGLERVDFEGDAIKDLISLRNNIVHRGNKNTETNIWKQIILVRELIIRIILSEVGFQGQYESYVGKYRLRDFPENQSTSDHSSQPDCVLSQQNESITKNIFERTLALFKQIISSIRIFGKTP